MRRECFVSVVLIACAAATINNAASAADPPNPFPIDIGYVHENKAITAIVSNIPKQKMRLIELPHEWWTPS